MKDLPHVRRAASRRVVRERDDPAFLAYVTLLAVVFLAAVTALPAPAVALEALPAALLP